MSSENKEITAALIFDIIGTPPEHLKETLNLLIDEINKEKGVKVSSRKVNEPILMKDAIDFYTTFAEIEIIAEEISQVVSLMFKYMPANVEIISPERISISNNNFSDTLSEITRRLHSYDEIVRIMQVEKDILEKKLRAGSNQKQEEKKMKIESVLPTMAAYMSYFNGYIRNAQEQGRVAPWTMEAIFQSRLEDEKKKIQPIYDSRRKKVVSDNSGIRFNVMA